MNKIWLAHYPKGVPAEIDPQAYQSIVEVLERSVGQYGSQVAYENLGSTMTYQELDKQSRAFAAYLQQELQCKPGDRIALMMPNLLQYPVCLFGAMRAGLIVVNVNPLYTPRELLHQVYDAGASVIVVLANFAHTLEHVLKQTKIQHVIVTQVGDMLAKPKSWIVNFVVKHVKHMVPQWHIPHAIKFSQAVSKGAKLHFDPISVRSDDIAFLQYTGGTTGIAKGAILTHRNIVSNLEQASAWVCGSMTLGQEVIITALPLYHIFSLLANCLMFMKIGAKNVLITNPKDISGFIKILKGLKKFTAVTGVNTLFNALLNNKDFASLDFSHLKLTLGGGMAVQHSVAERWEAVTKHPLLEAYGLTETSPAVAINPLNMQHYNGSIGLPIPSTDISIRDENGNELPLGEVGELCVKGPQVMRGYWNKPEETANVFTVDGFLRTGDMAMMDNDGFIYIKERKKDMILVSGFNVYPNEVEDVIASHPGVLEVAVVGVPADIAGEKIKAFIVKKDPSLSKEQVIAHCRDLLTGYKVPKMIEFVDSLPKSNVGKILRRELRDQEISRRKQEAE